MARRGDGGDEGLSEGGCQSLGRALCWAGEGEGRGATTEVAWEARQTSSTSGLTPASKGA